MAETLLYLDSSALVKLVLPERETAALRSILPRFAGLVSSALAEVEVYRAIWRVSSTPRLGKAQARCSQGSTSLT